MTRQSGLARITHGAQSEPANMQVSHSSSVSCRVRIQARSRSTAVLCRAAAKPKLIYFELPGRAETTRLMYTITKTPFEDSRIARDTWLALKPKTPFGQLPVLEVNGAYLAQSNAIERYVARQTGLYPTDAWAAAQVDSHVEFASELLDTFIPSFSIKDEAEKLAARKAVVEGPLAAKLVALNVMLANSANGFLVGDKMTWADVALFSMLSLLVCGFIAGVPQDLYVKYPEVARFHTRIASIPEVLIYYAGCEGYREAYKPQPAFAVATRML